MSDSCTAGRRPTGRASRSRSCPAASTNGRRAAGALIRRLQIVWPPGARRLSVALLPDCDDDDLALPVTPLDQWLARRPVRLASYSRRASWVGAARPPARTTPNGSAPRLARAPRKPAAERAALG